MAPSSRVACLLGLGVSSLVQIDAIRQRRNARSNQTKQDCYSPYDGQQLLSVEACRLDLVEALNEVIHSGKCVELSETGLNLPKAGCAYETVVCSTTVAADLKSRFGKYTSLYSEDAGAHFRSQSGGTEPFDAMSVAEQAADDSFYKTWRGLEDINSRVKAVVEGSGGAATLETVGKSVEGRDIKAVRITGTGWKSGKPRLFITFQVHAREWITGMAGVYAVEKMVAKAAADPSWAAGTQITLIPMVNPDGFKYSENSNRFWRKNRARKTAFYKCDGVDLNRNFPTDFGGKGSTSKNSCMDTFFGPKALSEPESQTVAKIMKEAPLSVHLDIHSFSELILAPWSWTSDAHPRKAEIMDLGRKMEAAVKGVNGVHYKMGDNLLYEASGVVSDYATELGALGYTYELRPGGYSGIFGFAPPAKIILPTAKETLAGLYAAVDWAKTA
jgi:predicted deacylase